MRKSILKLEQRFCALCMTVMLAVVFLDVIHRILSRMRGGAWAFTALMGVVIFAALRARGRGLNGKTAGLALVVTAGVHALLRLFLAALPNGLVWSQTLGLVLMLWIACIGSSMAAAQRTHLSLDVGSAVWPTRALPRVHALGHALTGVFCLVLGALSVVSVRNHFADYVDTDGAGGTFAALALPRWIAFLPMPVCFALMALRFLAQSVDTWRGNA